MAFLIFTAIQPVGAQPSTPVQANALDQKKLEAIFDRPGEVKDDVFKIAFPRTDLRVTLDGIPLKASLALSSWAAFKPVGNEAVVLGDLVLKEEELRPVESKLKEREFEITAVHNHLAGERPKVIYLHFIGKGKAEQLARNLREALRLTRTPLKAPKEPEEGAPGELESAEARQIDGILRKEGKIRNGVIQYSIPRKESIKIDGMEIPPSMGLSTALNFQPAKGKTVTTGDFVLTEKEVNPVIQALRESGISVTALHNHLLGEEPRLFFLHFWGVGPSSSLANGLKKALGQLPPPS
jgi:hypothetical protein